jgi:hypothetical protein
VSEDVDLNEQRVAAAAQGIMRMLAGCEETVLEKKKKSLSRHFQGLEHRHLCC